MTDPTLDDVLNFRVCGPEGRADTVENLTRHAKREREITPPAYRCARCLFDRRFPFPYGGPPEWCEKHLGYLVDICPDHPRQTHGAYDGWTPIAIEGFIITETGQTGCDTGRGRWRVECARCGELLHKATTGVVSRAKHHSHLDCPKEIR